MNGSEGIIKGSLIGFGTMVGTVVILSTLLTLAVSKSADPSSAVTAVSCASLLVGGAAGGAVAARVSRTPVSSVLAAGMLLVLLAAAALFIQDDMSAVRRLLPPVCMFAGATAAGLAVCAKKVSAADMIKKNARRAAGGRK